MKKTIIWLSAMFLTVFLLNACGEVDSAAALTVGYFSSEAGVKYTELVPDEEMQDRLLALLADIDFIDWSHDDRAFPDYKEISLGISVSYGGFSADLRTGGWIRRSEIDGLGIRFAQDEAFIGLVTELLAEYGYELFEPETVKPIVCAELCDGANYTGKAHEPIVLTDPDKLEKLTGLIGSSRLAEPSGCPFGYAKLVMTDSEGTVYELYPATDGCCRYFISGYFFNYDTSRGDDKHDTSQILFDLFEFDPMTYYHDFYWPITYGSANTD